jgi:hypothetical protein
VLEDVCLNRAGTLAASRREQQSPGCLKFECRYLESFITRQRGVCRGYGQFGERFKQGPSWFDFDNLRM